jgi:hypothetical protein
LRQQLKNARNGGGVPREVGVTGVLQW